MSTGIIADFSEADLTGEDFSNRDLSGCIFIGAKLDGVNLSHTDLRGADFTDAEFSDTDMSYSDARYSTFTGASMSNTDASYSWFHLSAVDQCVFEQVNLSYTNFLKANLHESTFDACNMHGARLGHAYDVDESAVELTRICPDGWITGYKALRGGALCKLRVPENAQRSNGTTRWCRASTVRVIDGWGFSSFDPTMEYRPSKVINCAKPFEENRFIDGSGIYFFLTEEEARDYAATMHRPNPMDIVFPTIGPLVKLDSITGI